jgi:hypothetical protein
MRFQALNAAHMSCLSFHRQDEKARPAKLKSFFARRRDDFKKVSIWPG